MAPRMCINSVNTFCYICGDLIIYKQKQKHTSFIKSVYTAYFGLSNEFKL